MASIARDKNGRKRLLYVDPTSGARKTIRLGKLPIKDAETIKHHVETLLACKTAGTAIPQATAQWLADLPDALYSKLVNAGLAEPRQKAAEGPTLGAWLETYLSKRSDAKPHTRLFYKQVIGNLLDCFGPERPITTLTVGDAEDFRRYLKAQGLAEATVVRRCKGAKTIFNAAVDHDLLLRNPFRKLKGSVKGNPARMVFVDRETIARVIDACPDAEWRCLVALARYGALRVPSEAVMLRWGDIDWGNNTMLVRSPKTEHHARCATRVIPLFPELRPYLEELWELAPEGAEYVIQRYHHLAERAPKTGFHNANLRTQFMRIIRRAGVEPWGKPWQNLRSSRETELMEHYPAHVVCRWVGNTQPVAREHYLQVTIEHYQRAAAEPTGPVPEAAQNAAQQIAEKGGILRKLPSQPIPQPVSIQELAAPFRPAHPPKVRPRGFEPLTPSSVDSCSIQLSYGRTDRPQASPAGLSSRIIPRMAPAVKTPRGGTGRGPRFAPAARETPCGRTDRGPTRL